jgi:GT2 family glycosyltransferase
VETLGRAKAFVSVVILSFNAKKFIKPCVRSVLSSEYPHFEVIVVDNASTDGSFEVLLAEWSKDARVKIIQNRRNIGFAAGNNVGFKASQGEIVVFLNVDTRVDRKWLGKLVATLQGNRSLGAVQSKLLSMKDPRKIDSLGGYLDTLGYVYSWGEWYAVKPGAILREPFYAEGAAMAVKRDAANQALLNDVPFDPDCFFFYDDSDLCWRLRLRGFSVALAKDSIVYHDRGYATGSLPSYAVFNSARNRVSTLIKNYGTWSLLKSLPILVSLEFLRGVTYLPANPLNARSKFSALFWCLTHLAQIWRKRIIVQGSIRNVSDTRILDAMLRSNLRVLFRSIGKEARIRAA